MGSNRDLYEQIHVAPEWRAYDFLWINYGSL